VRLLVPKFIIHNSSFLLANMTRELLFTNSFEPQLVAYTSWKSLVEVQGALTSTFAPSDYPGFEIVAGETKYTLYDSFGFPTNGVQAFTVRVHFAHAQLAIAAMRSTRSSDVSLLEAFFSGGFVPPPVSGGDLARIDGAQIVKIDPPLLSKTATRSSIVIYAEYFFTLF
jgi:hypothetical protein